MPKRPTVDTVSTGFTSQTTINNNFTNVRDQFDNTLSLDGSTPNAMQADLDMDSNDILNARTLRADNVFINGVAVTSGEAAAAPVATDVVITDAGGFYTGSNVETALQENGTTLAALGTAANADLTDNNDLTISPSNVPTRGNVAAYVSAQSPTITRGITFTGVSVVGGGTNTDQISVVRSYSFTSGQTYRIKVQGNIDHTSGAAPSAPAALFPIVFEAGTTTSASPSLLNGSSFFFFPHTAGQSARVMTEHYYTATTTESVDIAARLSVTFSSTNTAYTLSECAVEVEPVTTPTVVV